MNSQDISDDDTISQASYAPTPYVDSSWEIVGEAVETTEFAPMQVQILPRTHSFVDPMFANYGGIDENPTGASWHLPEEVARSYRQQLERPDSAEPEVATIAITEEELEEIKQQAYMEGQQSGLEAAISANAEKMELAEARLLQLMEDLQKQVGQHQSMLERNAIELATKISLKIVHHTVSINPEYIVPVLREALGLTGTAQIKRVRVSAQDLEFIKLVGLQKAIKGFDGSWEFIADETVRNGCIVETSAGQIDFQLDPAWRRIRDKVVKVL
jgi:flagellar biosynthesis/type III secretory pathway protein FliH